MKVKYLAIACVFMATTALKAEQFGGFLESVYDELQMLNLSKEQEVALKNVIKNHHKFLKQWYSDTRTNNEKIMKNFGDSSLKNNAPEFAFDKSFANDKIHAEHRFMMSVYEILDKNQRRIFSIKINKKSENKGNTKDKSFLKYGE